MKSITVFGERTQESLAHKITAVLFFFINGLLQTLALVSACNVTGLRQLKDALWPGRAKI